MRPCLCQPIHVHRSSVTPSHQWSSSAEASRRVACLCIRKRSVVARGGTSLLAIHHPRYAESIDNHTEARRPERLLQRHLHFTALLQFLKDALPFRNVFHSDRQGEALRRLIV